MLGGFEARLILTVSWHRNESSVKSYVRDTTSERTRHKSVTISKLEIYQHEANVSEQRNSVIGETNCDFPDDILCLSVFQTEYLVQDITNFENNMEEKTYEQLAR